MIRRVLGNSPHFRRQFRHREAERFAWPRRGGNKWFETSGHHQQRVRGPESVVVGRVFEEFGQDGGGPQQQRAIPVRDG